VSKSKVGAIIVIDKPAFQVLDINDQGRNGKPQNLLFAIQRIQGQMSKRRTL
jgi:hypothetical protein